MIFDAAVLGGLLANFLITMCFVVAWAYLAAEVTQLRRVVTTSLAGLFMGLASIFSLRYAVPLGEGIIVDLRSVPIAAAALFAGPLAGLIAAGLAIVTRLVIGGHAALLGAVGIALAALVGVSSFYLLRRRSTVARIVSFALALAIVPLLPVFFLPVPPPFVLAIAGFSFVGALASAAALERSYHLAAEKRLLKAAVSAAPDYLYVKDTDSRLVAYSAAVAAARHAGPTELLGKTDLDLEQPERGAALFKEEQELLAGRATLEGKLEQVVAEDGRARWFKTSKSIVPDPDGRPIGLVGITRDVTEEHRQEAETRGVVDRLSLILSQMADGVALFDQDCRIIFCNEQYHRMFPLTRDLRVPGASLRDVLSAAIERGEQPYVSGDSESWINRVISGIVGARDEEVNLIDGRTLSVRNRPVEALGYVSVVSDITETKRTETHLAMMSEQLRLLATRDFLTGLVNRRALDDQFERELARSERGLAPISVLMIDVDKFKAYNDHYGHQAGDACLKAVATHVKGVAGRSSDIAARYGGEEFCIVLPDTTDEGAMQVAERLRSSIEGSALPHEASQLGVVTASIGIASYASGASPRSCAELIARADEALYAAKHAGRNTCVAWSLPGNEARLRTTGS